MNPPPSMDRKETFLKMFEFMELQISLYLIKHILQTDDKSLTQVLLLH